MKIRVAKWNQKEGNTLVAGDLVRVNDNKPEYGSMMVVSETREFSPGGFTNKRTKVAFIAGRVEDLEDMIQFDHLREGSDFNKIYGEHKIVTVEKLESEVGERDGFQEKINPSTGEVLTKDGEAIMRRTYLVPETSELQDTLIEHDREEVDAEPDPAIAEFQAAGSKTK